MRRMVLLLFSLTILPFGGGCSAATIIGGMAGWVAGRGLDHYVLKESPAQIFPHEPQALVSAAAMTLRQMGVEEFLLEEKEDGTRRIEAELSEETSLSVKIKIVPVALRMNKVFASVKRGLIPEDDVAQAILLSMTERLRPLVRPERVEATNDPSRTDTLRKSPTKDHLPPVRRVRRVY